MNDEPQDEVLEAEVEVWPFPGISPEAYYSMPEAYRAGIEQIVRDMISGKNSKH